VIKFSIIFAFLASPVLAGNYDGTFRPEGALDWTCTGSGSYGGAIAVRDNTLFDIEIACDLSNATPVRDMNATLYDGQCLGLAGSFRQRVMLMRTNSGIAIIRGGEASEWVRCS
jgi:hypothetical protein